MTFNESLAVAIVSLVLTTAITASCIREHLDASSADQGSSNHSDSRSGVVGSLRQVRIAVILIIAPFDSCDPNHFWCLLSPGPRGVAAFASSSPRPCSRPSQGSPFSPRRWPLLLI